MKIARFLLAAACVGVSCSALAQGRFGYSADGAEVTDSQTGLVWRRCSEGQTWSGNTCTGSASNFTHEGALVHAQSQAGWRLPNVKELGSIADRTNNSPAINGTAFPSTVSFWYWSSSPLIGDVSQSQGVDFGDGFVGNQYRINRFSVRLVR